MFSRVINISPREKKKTKEAWGLNDSTIPCEEMKFNLTQNKLAKIEHSGAYVYHDYSECIDIACPTNRVSILYIFMYIIFF